MRLLVLIVALFAALPGVADEVDFTLPDLQGNPVSLSDFRGKWVVVNYWATWCPPCLDEIPDLVEFHEDNRDKDAMVIGIDFEEVNLAYLKEFVESHFISYPVLRMDPGMVTELGPVQGLPTTYIISPQGERIARQEGPITREALEAYLARKRQQSGNVPPVIAAGSRPPSTPE